jgi:hypothetical protein
VVTADLSGWLTAHRLSMNVGELSTAREPRGCLHVCVCALESSSPRLPRTTIYHASD